MYLKLSGPERSVHSEKYPEPDTYYIDTELENEFKYAISVMELSRRARQESNIKGRQVVSEVLIYSDMNIEESILDIISPELNSQSIKFIKEKEKPVKVTIKPVFSKVAPILRGNTNKFTEWLAKANLYSELKTEGKITYEGHEFTPEYLDVHEEPVETYAYAGDEKTGISVYINKEIDENLMLAGYAREIIRRIQIMRKDLDLEYSQNIVTEINAEGDIRKSVEKFMGLIKNETLSTEVRIANNPYGKVWDISGENVVIYVKPVS
jgi:isoleucyl-tRNA synthetase